MCVYVCVVVFLSVFLVTDPSKRRVPTELINTAD